MPTAPEVIHIHIGDLLRDTEHLSNVEFAAYHRLFYACFAACGTLPNDETKLRRIARINRMREWRQVWGTLRPFFQLNEYQKLTHKRVSSDLAKALKYRERQSAAAQRRLVLKKEDRSYSVSRDSVPPKQPKKEAAEKGNGASLAASSHLTAAMKRKGWAP